MNVSHKADLPITTPSQFGHGRGSGEGGPKSKGGSGVDRVCFWEQSVARIINVEREKSQRKMFAIVNKYEAVTCERVPV